MKSRTLTAPLLAATIALGGVAGTAPATAAPAGTETTSTASDTHQRVTHFGLTTVSENGAGLLGLTDAVFYKGPWTWITNNQLEYSGQPGAEFEAQTASFTVTEANPRSELIIWTDWVDEVHGDSFQAVALGDLRAEDVTVYRDYSGTRRSIAVDLRAYEPGDQLGLALVGTPDKTPLLPTPEPDPEPEPEPVEPTPAPDPVEVTRIHGTGHDGATQLPEGVVATDVEGLAKTESEALTKVPGPATVNDSAGTHITEVAVPDGATSLVLDLKAQDDVADWDLFVFSPSGQLTEVATTGGSEHLTITDPAAGTWTVLSNLYSSQDGGEADAVLEHTALAGDAGNLSVDGGEVSWSGLTEGRWTGLLTGGDEHPAVVAIEAEGTPFDAPDFGDNEPGSQFYEPIRWMQEHDLTRGYADGTFGKNRDISRGESVAWIYRHAGHVFQAPDKSPFSDVSTTFTHFTPITWASAQDITTGYKDGTFRPGRAVTRGEFAAFLYRAMGPEQHATKGWAFPDVPSTRPHAEAIAWLASSGAISGYTDGTFRPDRPITRGEAAKVLHGAAHLD